MIQLLEDFKKLNDFTNNFNTTIQQRFLYIGRLISLSFMKKIWTLMRVQRNV